MKNRYKIEEAKRVSIIGYLKSIGHDPEYQTGSTAFYFSPWRAENVPSMGVSLRRNMYKDFGASDKAGDILDLIMKVEKCALPKAIRIATEGRNGSPTPQWEEPIERERKEYVKVRSVDPIGHRDLWKYVTSRGVSLYTASKFTKQLCISFPHSKTNPDKEHFVIGFLSDAGGYEMRNAYLKICNSPKTISTIHGRDADKVVMFEGFFDMLSYMEMWGRTNAGDTVIVLNSTSFMGAIVPMLVGKTVYGYFDNDEAGDHCFQLLRESGIAYADCRYHYEDYNDLNQYWVEQQKQ